MQPRCVRRLPFLVLAAPVLLLAGPVFGVEELIEVGDDYRSFIIERVRPGLVALASAVLSFLSFLVALWQFLGAPWGKSRRRRPGEAPMPTKAVSRVAVSVWRFASFVYSRKTFRLVFEPILMDLLLEHREALERGLRHKARWVLIRGYWSFWSAVVAQAPVSLTRLIVKLWKVSGPGG